MDGAEHYALHKDQPCTVCQYNYCCNINCSVICNINHIVWIIHYPQPGLNTPIECSSTVDSV